MHPADPIDAMGVEALRDVQRHEIRAALRHARDMHNTPRLKPARARRHRTSALRASARSELARILADLIDARTGANRVSDLPPAAIRAAHAQAQVSAVRALTYPSEVIEQPGA